MRAVGRLENEYSLKNNQINDFVPYARPCVCNTSILGISELRKVLELSVLNYSEHKMNNFVRKTTAVLTYAHWINVVKMFFVFFCLFLLGFFLGGGGALRPHLLCIQ